MKRAAALQREAAFRKEAALGSSQPSQPSAPSQSSQPASKRARCNVAESLHSKSSDRMLGKVCDGRMQVTEAQAMAADIQKDYGPGVAAVDALASLGSQGKNPGNCYRDLMRWAQQLGISLDVGVVSTPVRNLRDHGEIMVDHHVLYPHEVFSACWSFNPKAFEYIFLGPGAIPELVDYWKMQETQPWVPSHPGWEHGGTYENCIPIGIHGDKGAHIRKDKILVLSWNSVMTRAPTIWSKILYTVVPNEVLIPGSTDERLYAVLAWSLHWLLRGVYPPCDHDGVPWPENSVRRLNAGKPLAGRGDAYQPEVFEH